MIRNNYFIQVDDNLAWSHSIGPEDPPAPTSSEAEPGKLNQFEGWAAAEDNKAIEQHHFRSERQTLRRLPRSGAVVFTIRTYFEPVTKIAEEDGVPARLANGIRAWGEDSARYKGRDRYEKVLLGYLDGKAREQEERGVPKDESKYPF